MKFPFYLPLLFLLGACTGHNTSHTYNIIDFGAKPGTPADNAAAIQKAIDKCNEAGGGTVIVPAGEWFMTGPFELKSFVNLHLEPNSQLIASPDESIYTESAFGDNRGEGMMWIYARDVKNVSSYSGSLQFTSLVPSPSPYSSDPSSTEIFTSVPVTMYRHTLASLLHAVYNF